MRQLSVLVGQLVTVLIALVLFSAFMHRERARDTSPAFWANKNPFTAAAGSPVSLTKSGLRDVE
ncbi:hypothetical protein HS125_15110 [bacterium]|nr:hypothetical protein [bacterium]